MHACGNTIPGVVSVLLHPYNSKHRTMHVHVRLYMYVQHAPKKTCLESRVASFTAIITCIHRARTRELHHGCTGKGRHATQTTTRRFSRPMPLLLLYRAPSFRSLCTEGCARTIRSTCNVIRESAATLQHVLFAQVQTLFLAHTYCIHVCMYVHVRMYSTCECVYVHVHTYVRTYLGTRSIDYFTCKHILVECIYVRM